MVSLVAPNLSGTSNVRPVNTGPGYGGSTSAPAPSYSPIVRISGNQNQDRGNQDGGSQGGSRNPSFRQSSAFTAQLLAQEDSSSSSSGITSSIAARINAAYQTTQSRGSYRSSQSSTQFSGNADIQLPGVPAPLASGRIIDLLT